MLLYDAQDSIPFLRSEPVLHGKLDLHQPDLRCRFRLIHVNVRRLVRLVAVKVEAETIDAQDGGHTLSVASDNA